MSNFENESLLKDYLKQIQDCEELIEEASAQLLTVKSKSTKQSQVLSIQEDLKFYKTEKLELLKSISRYYIW